MFLNIFPILSMLILCLLLCSSEELVKRKLLPEFIDGKAVAGILGSFILFWGIYKFIGDFNYIKYSFQWAPISIILRLLLTIYFIVCGFVISFKGIGGFLFNKNDESSRRYKVFYSMLKSYHTILRKTGLILLVIYLANFLLQKYMA